MIDANLTYASITTQAEMLRTGKLSSKELTEAHLTRIDALDAELRAFISVTAKSAMDEALNADSEIANGEYRGPLHGIPVALKDVINTSGLLTTSGSRVRADYIPDSNASVTKCLKKSGAVLIGKTNLSEFAMGGTIDHPFGTPRNPWNPSRTPGGSSSGSAIAVASGMVAGSLGSDTGGSIRGPASYCGVVGIRPTFGLVSRHGVTPVSWSMDTIGPFARTVRDCATLLQSIAGYDTQDSTTNLTPAHDYDHFLDCEVRGMRIGIPMELSEFEGLDPEIEFAFQNAVDVLEGLGISPIRVSLPWIDLTSAPVILITDADAASYHAESLRDQGNLYDLGSLVRLESGTLTPATAYLRAQRLRKYVQREMASVFADVDILIAPNTPTAAPSIEDASARPGGIYSDLDQDLPRRRFTSPASLAGLPTLALPCGFTIAGLPIGLQLIGRQFDEGNLFRLGQRFEEATPWHMMHPKL